MNYFKSLVIRKEHLYEAHFIEETSIYIRRIYIRRSRNNLFYFLRFAWILKIFIAAAHDLIFF